MSANNELAAINTRVAIVEKEVSAVYGVFSRFEATIEKLVDVSNSLKELAAVHDNRLIEREKADLTIFDMMERRKEEYSRGVERVSQKIEDLTTELRKEIRSEINEQYDDLKDAVNRFERSLKEVAEKTDKRIDQAIQQRDERINDLNKLIKDQGNRIAALERWRWFVLGACAAVGFIVGKYAGLAALFS